MKNEGTIPMITKARKGNHKAWCKGLTPHEKEMLSKESPVIIFQDKALANRILAKYGMA